MEETSGRIASAWKENKFLMCCQSAATRAKKLQQSLQKSWKRNARKACVCAAAMTALCVSWGLADSGPLFGVTGAPTAGGVYFNGDGFIVSGTIWDAQTLQGEPANPKLPATSDKYVSTSHAFDPATRTFYTQKVSGSGVYFASYFTTTGAETDLYHTLGLGGPLAKPYRNFVYDRNTHSIVGLAGTGQVQFGAYGFMFSGTGFERLSLKDEHTQTTLAADTSNYIATAQAYDEYSHILYMQRIMSDGVHLVSLNTVTGAFQDLKRLNSYFRTMVFDEKERVLYGLYGNGGSGFGRFGFTLSGQGFGRLDPNDSSQDIELLRANTSTFVASTMEVDPASRRVFMQRVNGTTVSLVSLDLDTGEMVDIKEYPESFKIFTMDNPPPSEYVLAEMSNQAYQYEYNEGSSLEVNGYKFIPIPMQENFHEGFYAQVYKKGSQVVVAFRGTELDKDNYTMIYDCLADTSWGLGDANQALESKVSQAITFLKVVYEQLKVEDPTINITLTGHSLGGAIAQLLAYKSKLPAVVFDSPEPGNLYENDKNLQSILDRLNTEFKNTGPIRHLRLWGDVISRIGTPFEGVDLKTVSTLPSLSPYVGYWSSVLDNHAIRNITNQVWLGAEKTNGNPDPLLELFADVLGTIVHNVKLPYSGAVSFVLDAVSPGSFYPVDPSPAAEYAVEIETGAPPFKAIVLPRVDGVEAYGVTLMSEAGWSDPVRINPVQKLEFSSPVRSFKFWAIGPGNSSVEMPNSFLFDASFTEPGRVVGTVTPMESTRTLPSSLTGPLMLLLK